MKIFIICNLSSVCAVCVYVCVTSSQYILEIMEYILNK